MRQNVRIAKSSYSLLETAGEEVRHIQKTVGVKAHCFLYGNKSGISRLKNICEIKYSFTASIHIYQYRNRLMHYTLNGTFEQIIRDVSDAMKEIAEFVEKEIIGELPQEAQNDFEMTIVRYREYATILKELKL